MPLDFLFFIYFYILIRIIFFSLLQVTKQNLEICADMIYIYIYLIMRLANRHKILTKRS